MKPRIVFGGAVLLACCVSACAADTGQLDDAVDAVGTAEELMAPGEVAALRNVKSKKCIGVDRGSTAAGAYIKQFTCDGAANQGWKRQPASEVTFRLVNSRGPMCIGVDRASENPGADLRQFPCDTSDNQQWLLLEGADDLVFVNLKSGLCIGVDGASTANGAQLKQFGCDERPNQRWIPEVR